MINLLPEKQKKRVERERAYLLITFLMVYLIIFLFAFSGTLYGLSIFTAETLEEERAILKEKEDLYFEILEKDRLVEEVNEIAPRFDAFYREQISLTELVKKISASLPEEAHVTGFRLASRDGEDKLITLEGYAGNWEDLLFIEDRLEESFSDVSFSPGVWAQVSDINFTVTFYK